MEYSLVTIILKILVDITPSEKKNANLKVAHVIQFYSWSILEVIVLHKGRVN